MDVFGRTDPGEVGHFYIWMCLHAHKHWGSIRASVDSLTLDQIKSEWDSVEGGLLLLLVGLSRSRCWAKDLSIFLFGGEGTPGRGMESELGLEGDYCWGNWGFIVWGGRESTPQGHPPPRKRTGWSLFLGLLIPLLHSQATTWVEKVVLRPENALKQQAACAGSLTWLSEGS